MRRLDRAVYQEGSTLPKDIIAVSYKCMISKKELNLLYRENGLSAQQIAVRLGCSATKVCYWMKRHGIRKRTISEAVYLKSNPDGDPFCFKQPESIEEAVLYGLGMGLYWGEGTKANKHSVRLGNTDPELIKAFMDFLERLWSVSRDSMRFGLQLFTDCSEREALTFWQDKLKVSSNQFYKVTRTVSGSVGTYRKKNVYGVLTIYFNNKKLRDKLVGRLPVHADIAQ